MEQVADPLVGGEIVERPAIARIADARLFRAVAPMLHAVARPHPLEAAAMIDVDLAGMPRHRLGEAPGLRIAGTQHLVPQPQVRREFAIVPRKAPNVVAPAMPVAVIGMHHVAMVPETVPSAAIDFARVEVDEVAQLVLDRCAVGGRPIGQAPVAEHLRGVEVRGCDHQLRRLGLHRREPLQQCAVGRRRERPQHQFAGPRDPCGIVPAGLVIFVGDRQAFILRVEALHPHRAVIRSHVHRRRLGRPQPRRQRGGVAGRAIDVQRGRMPLPEIAHAERRAALRRADIRQPRRAVPFVGVDPTLLGRGALGDRPAIGARLLEPEVAPGGDPLERRAHRLGHRVERRHRAAGDLRRLERHSGIAPQPGQRAHPLGEELRVGGEAHVAIVERGVLHRHARAHAQRRNEIPRRAAIEHDAVDHPQPARPGIGIEPHDERQPAALAREMRALDLHDRANRTSLFDGNALDPPCEGQVGAVERFGARGTDEGDGAEHRAAGDARLLHQRRTRFADAPLQIADADRHRIGALGHADGACRHSGAAARDAQAVGRDVGGDRVRAPLDRAVGPARGGPALRRDRRAVPRRHAQRRAALDRAARPGDAEGLPRLERGRRAVDPAHRRRLKRRDRGRAQPRRQQRDAAPEQSRLERLAAIEHISLHQGCVTDTRRMRRWLHVVRRPQWPRV